MISLTELQKEIDKVFIGTDYRARHARLGVRGFFISCPILTRAFSDWLEKNYPVRLKNVQSDQDENPQYIKAFFEELEA